MSELATMEDFGVLTEPSTLKIERLLPGPIERVWSHLTDGYLRRQWLAAGDMEMKVGSTFEFIWRNDELTDPPGPRPEGMSEEHRMESRITELDPPRKLSFTWSGSGDVTIELKPEGDDVLLALTHRRLPNRKSLLGVSTGWHMHLGLLVDRLNDRKPQPFWSGWSSLRKEYDKRLPS